MGKTSKKGKSKEQIAKEKVERFMRIAPVRTTKALKAIMLIGNCSGSGYSYTDGQANRIIVSLSKALVVLEKQFKGVATKTAEFSFDDSE